ncbi:MAG TPA: SRPBCC domain-containing protein [Xanthomonadales bacterium]|nr:SRPBCC domain-containing protein [Xanthomonadales bacterium]
MTKLHFSIDIKAPREKVWDTMMEDQTYREWTSVFNPGGSYYEGDWSEGSKMLFLGPDEKTGKVGGMVSRIAVNKPGEFMSIEHLGEIIDGVEDTTSDRVKQWAGAHENYTLSEENGVTTLQIDLDGGGEEMESMFKEMWPKALQKLKEISEK